MRTIRTRFGCLLVLAALVVAACNRGDAPADPVGSPSTSLGSTGVSGPTAPAFPVTITDDDGVEVTLPAEPERIITFAPSATEIVFALGLGDRLVGVAGAFDDYPVEAAEIEPVGGAGDFGVDPNVEKVVDLEPDLFLTIKGGDQWKAGLRDLGVPVVTLDAADLDDLLGDIEVVGRITGTADVAAELVADMEAEADRVAAALAGVDPVSCFYETFYPPLYTVGPGTFIYDLLVRAGCDPVTSSAGQQYPEWSVEDLVDQGPEVYLVSSESGASPRAVAHRVGFEAIDAVAEGRVEPIDSDLAERPGPRIIQGLLLLVEALHPEALP